MPRKLLTIGILLAVMIGLTVIGGDADKTLATLGFILLAAYTLGEVVKRVGLPQLVGYILSGVIFGPHLSALIYRALLSQDWELSQKLHGLLGEGAPTLFGTDVVDALTLVNLLAQGLIGLTAGGELKVPDLKRDIKSIAWLLGMQTLLVLVAVGATMYAVASWFPGAMPFLKDSGAVLAAALLFGALAVGTSPATTLAVITETRAKGPLSTLTLGTIVAKDITTVTLYLIVVSIAASLASGGDLSMGDLAHALGVELGGAIGMGIAMGILIVLYLWLLGTDKMLFIIALVFVGQWVAALIHAEALLAFMVAGFLVSNAGLVIKRFKHQGEVMIHELERLSLPVFVVFFTIAAAKLELAALADYWAVALAYIVVRAAMMYLGTRAGVRLAGAAPKIKEFLWWGFFPQAGVTLTLAGLIQGKISWATEFQTIIMSTIFINIIAGPVMLKIGLTRAGEAGAGGDEPGHDHGHAHQEGQAHAEASQATELEDDPELISLSLARKVPRADSSGARHARQARQHKFELVEFPEPALEHDQLNRVLHKLKLRLGRIYEETIREYLDQRRDNQNETFSLVSEAVQEVLQDTVEHLEELAAEARAAGGQIDPMEDLPAWADPEQIYGLLQGARSDLIEEVTHIVVTEGASSEHTDATERLLQDVLSRVDQAIKPDRELLRVPQEDALFVPREEDSAYVKLGKRLKRLLRPLGVARQRSVPVELLTRYYVGLPMPPQLLSAANLLGSQRLYTWRKVRILYHLADQIFAEALSYLESDPNGGGLAPTEALHHLYEEAEDTARALAATRETPVIPDAPDIEALEQELAAEAQAIQVRKETREPVTARMAQFFQERQEDLKEDCALAQQDLGIYADDMERRFLLALVTPYRQLNQAMHKAGTFELPARSLAPARLFEDYRSHRVEIMDAVRHWRTFSHGFAGSIVLELEVSRVEVRLRELLQRTLRDIDRELLSTLSYHAAEFCERVVETQQRIEQELRTGQEPEPVQKMINRERALLLGFVNDNALIDIQELRESRRFSHILEMLMGDLRKLADAGPEVISVASQDAVRLGDGSPMHEPRLLEVPLRQVLHEALEREVAVQLSDVELRLTGLIERVSAEILEVGRIVGFNLEAAAGELQSPGEAEWSQGEADTRSSRKRRGRRSRQPRLTREGKLTETGVTLPQEFAQGGLQRAQERLEALNEAIVLEGGEIEQELREETVKPLLQIHKLVADGDPAILQRYLFQRELADEMQKRAEESQGVLRSAGERVLNFYREKLQPVGVEVAAGLTPAGHSRDYRLDHVATRVSEAVQGVWGREDLPEIYRRLFSPTPTELADFFVPRDEVLESFQAAARRWLEGHETTIAVLGETGAGRTSFVNYALQATLDGMPTVRRTLARTVVDEATLVEELAALSGGREQDLNRLQLRLRNRQERTVVVIEEAENLFLRSQKGMELLRRFLSLIGQTSSSVLWVLSMNSHAWAYLETMLRVSDHFTHLLNLRPLARDELENVIMTRHRVSGYQLVFDEHIGRVERLRQRMGAWLEGQDGVDPGVQRQRHYFDHLHQVSRGNPMLGVYYWLRSVSQVQEESHLLRVKPVEPVDLDVIHDLDEDKLLTLAFTIQHHGLTIAEFSQVFRVSEDEARAGLVHLTHMGLLYIDPGAEDCYRIHRVLQLPIVEILRSRNML